MVEKDCEVTEKKIKNTAKTFNKMRGHDKEVD